MQPEPALAAIDLSHLDQYRDQPAKLRAFILSLLADGPEILREIKACAEREEVQCPQALLHTFAGMAVNAGAESLGARCLLLSERWKGGELPASGALDPLFAEFNAIREALERYLSRLSPDASAAARPAATAPTVMLVEDNASTRLLLRVILGGRYALLEAANGQEALELMESHIPDLAIVDLNLGRPSSESPSGLHLLRRLKVRIPTLVLTVDRRPESIRRAAEAGAWGYLVKTQEMHDLLPAIEILLARAPEIQKAANANEIAIATGWLMATYRIDRDVAGQILAGYATKTRCRPADLARDLLETQSFFNSIGRHLANHLAPVPDPDT